MVLYLHYQIKINTMTASKNLIELFVELINIELSKYNKVSMYMLANTIQHYANMSGFNQYRLEYWHTVASANGIKAKL